MVVEPFTPGVACITLPSLFTRITTITICSPSHSPSIGAGVDIGFLPDKLYPAIPLPPWPSLFLLPLGAPWSPPPVVLPWPLPVPVGLPPGLPELLRRFDSSLEGLGFSTGFSAGFSTGFSTGFLGFSLETEGASTTSCVVASVSADTASVGACGCSAPSGAAASSPDPSSELPKFTGIPYSGGGSWYEMPKNANSSSNSACTENVVMTPRRWSFLSCWGA